MTYRERREARAERLRGWAGSREQKSETAFGNAHRIAEQIPFGQPILVGHHSEGRARRDQGRIENGMRAGIEHSRKAESMRSRAENIEAAAKRAIYSDDENAIEALEARIVELEEKRVTIKTRNAEYKKTHAAELKSLTPYQRDRAMPHASYELTNLSGNINRNKKRLEQLTRAQVQGERPRVMSSRFESTCDECGETIEKGTTIHYFKSERRAIHANCESADVNIHESGQLGLAVAGEQVSLLPLADAATPTALPERSDAGPTIFKGQASLDV
jgi:Domain of unknown function (DUF3560)